MHKESFYQFILYVLQQEGESNLPFKFKALLMGKRRASARCMKRLFEGCDVASFLHLCQQFQHENPDVHFQIGQAEMLLDSHGLMTGELRGKNT